LEIADEARKQAGVTEHNRTLSDTQREQAYAWLQHHFEKRFLHNADIKQGIADVEAHPEKFGGRQIKILKDTAVGMTTLQIV